MERGWDVCVVATPTAARWIDGAELTRLTGHPVRSAYKLPHEPDVLPPPDAIVVAPVTFNTVNKWAAGIADTLVLGLLTESVGMNVPIVAVPYLNEALARHPAFERSVALLRDVGVALIYGPDVFPLHEPRQGGDAQRARYPWKTALDAVSQRP